MFKTEKLDDAADSEQQTLTIGDRTLVSPVQQQGAPTGPRRIEAGITLSGKYRLDRLLGSGGMGQVYQGEHLTLGARIAVKIMRPEVASNPESVRRFRREAYAVSRLHHPNVVRVLDFDQDAALGLVYLIMELLEGCTVSDWLESLAGPPPLADVERVMRELLDAFEAAHALGIVHRDLKPENIFLSRGIDGKQTLKIVDFGLAHVDDARDEGPTLTQKDVVSGTPQYMSPEQCKSLVVGPSSDIYAIGCVLTDLLQRRPPFEGDSAIEIISKQLFMTPPPLKRPDGAEPVPPLLERLRLALLAKTPERRPADVQEIRARLLEALSPEATAARLPARKGDEPLGARAERIPQWGGERPKPATSSADDASTHQEVELVRLETSDRGVTPMCISGLAAHGIEVRETPGAEACAVMVLDAGSDTAGALARLQELGAGSPAPKVVVCVAQVSGDEMNQLIAAGAADVVIYPVSADALAKKIERARRRRR